MCATLLAGCAAPYLVQQGLGQARILFARRPVEDVLADPEVSGAMKQRLRLIGDVRSWGEERLGFVHTKSYESYVDTHGEYPSWLLTACPPDSLDPETWTFPIVGTVPYLGFFDIEDARAERDRLREKGLDVQIRPVRAYSTLGWFSDPIFSTFAAEPVHEVAHTILHETTHATVWIPGDVATNESFATFVGDEGARLFLADRFGPDSPEARAALDARAEEALVRVFVLRARDALKAVYALDIPRHDKLQMKAAVFSRFRALFLTDLKPRLTSTRFLGLGRIEWNNAFVAGFAVYHAGEDTWRRLLAAHGGDLKAMIAFTGEAARQPDPRAVIERRVSSER